MELWPAFLQDKLDADTFQLELGKNMLRSSVEAGPDKVRPIYTKSIDVYTSSIRVSYDEFEDLMDFFKITLSFGTKTFSFLHPFTQVNCEWRFLSEPKISPLGNGGIEFRVNFQWELINYDIP